MKKRMKKVKRAKSGIARGVATRGEMRLCRLGRSDVGVSRVRSRGRYRAQVQARYRIPSLVRSVFIQINPSAQAKLKLRKRPPGSGSGFKGVLWGMWGEEGAPYLLCPTGLHDIDGMPHQRGCLSERCRLVEVRRQMVKETHLFPACDSLCQR